MNLPQITDIADQHSLECNPKTVNKKEVRYKCPFCQEDANRRNKYFLSLNPEKNVFKCWYCKESGGVLLFESKLTDKPYDEIRKKYSNGKPLHPAQLLSPSQLEKINWRELKQRNYEQYRQSLAEVESDWKVYKYDQRSLAFAKLLLATMGDHDKCQMVLELIAKQGKEDGIKHLLSDVINAYIMPKAERPEWAIRGREMAVSAYTCMKRAKQEGVTQAILYLLFIHCFSYKPELEKRYKNYKKQIKMKRERSVC